jgi:hypothetical protein
MILTKAGYANHRNVRRQAVYNWVRRKKLRAPALRADGTIDVARADAQLAVTVDPVLAVRGRLPSGAGATPAADGEAPYLLAEEATTGWAKACADFMQYADGFADLPPFTPSDDPPG